MLAKLVLLTLLFQSTAEEAEVVRGRVRNALGEPVPSVDVRLVGFSGTTTTTSGEFEIMLPRGIRYGTRVQLSVEGWAIKQPPAGYVAVERVPHITTLVVARPGNDELLTPGLMKYIAQEINQECAPRGLAMCRARIVAEIASAYQLSPQRIASELDGWLSRAEGSDDESDRIAALMGARKYSDARTNLENVVDRTEHQLSVQYHLLGTANYFLGDLDQTIQAYEKALVLDPGSSATRNMLGLACLSRFNHACAETHLGEILRDLLEKSDPPDADLAQAYNNVGSAYLGGGDLVRAQTSFERALRHVDVTDLVRFTTTRNNLAAVQTIAGRFSEAGNTYAQTESSLVSALGNDNPQVALLRINYGGFLTQAGEYEKAKITLESSREVFRDSYGDQHIYYGVATVQLGQLYLVCGDPWRAELLVTEGMDVIQRARGDVSRLKLSGMLVSLPRFRGHPIKI